MPEHALEYQQLAISHRQRKRLPFKCIMNWPEAADDASLKSLFTSLAAEETKHKVRLELEYDTQFFNQYVSPVTHYPLNPQYC